MIRHRCPWCGEYLPLEPILWYRRWQIKPDTCPSCKKPYAGCANYRNAGVLFALFIVVYTIVLNYRVFGDGSSVLSILFWIVCICFPVLMIGVYQLPYDRLIKKKECPHIRPKTHVPVTITWKKHRDKGLLLPRAQMKNGEIFPACFMDAQGTPISTAYCVVLEHMYWKGFHSCACQISLVLDDAPEEKLLLKGNRFYLYHHYEIIASGVIDAFSVPGASHQL